MRVVIAILWLLTSTLCAAADGDRIVRAYDIVELLDMPRDLPAPVLGVATTVDPRNPLPPPPAKVVSSDRITPDAALARIFDPGLCELITGTSEWRSGHLLVLNAKPALHEQVERALANARDRAQVQVRFNVKLVLMEPHLRLSRFPLPRLDWQPLTDQPGLFVAELDTRDLEYTTNNLRLNSRPSKELETTHYPQIAAFAGQLAHAATVSFADHRPMSLKQGEVTSRVALGDTVAVRATPSPDLRYLLLEIDHQRCAQVDRQTMDFGTSGAAEMPVLWRGGERFRRSIPIGWAVVIATGAYLDGKQPRSGFLIVTPELRTGVTPVPQVTIQSP